MFILSQRNKTTGVTEWFFAATEGILGHYDSKEAAQKVMDEYVLRRKTSPDPDLTFSEHILGPDKPKEPAQKAPDESDKWRRLRFSSDRIFSQTNNETGLIEWFFNAREGIFGPYRTRESTQQMLKEFVEKRKNSGDDGGRSKKAGGAPTLSLETRAYDAVVQEYDPFRRKKGVEI